MDSKCIQAWTSCEVEEFKALVAKIRNEKSCDRMEELAKRFPAKTMQQLSDQYVDVFAEMLCAETDGEPSSHDATIDLHDWYKLLQGDTDDSVLDPSVEPALNQPSEQLLDEAACNLEEMHKSHCKSSQKRRQFWTPEEHRQFLLGVQRLGRGEWKFISEYFVPSRTPAQLASHAQKYFKRMKENEQGDNMQRYSINDVKLVNPDLNTTSHCLTGPGQVIPDISSIPPPIPIEDINFLLDLSQGMPDFREASSTPPNFAGHMALSSHTSGCGQWEFSSIPSPIEQRSVLLDQTGGFSAESMNYPSWKSLGAATNQRCKNSKQMLPGFVTAPAPQEILQFGQRGNGTANLPSEMAPFSLHDLHPTMPPF